MQISLDMLGCIWTCSWRKVCLWRYLDSGWGGLVESKGIQGTHAPVGFDIETRWSQPEAGVSSGSESRVNTQSWGQGSGMITLLPKKYHYGFSVGLLICCTATKYRRQLNACIGTKCLQTREKRPVNASVALLRASYWWFALFQSSTTSQWHHPGDQILNVWT